MRPKIRLLGALALVPMLAGCSLTYLAKQGFGQIQLLTQRESLEAARADARLSPEARAKLEIVTAAKAYGVREIGLKENASYDMVTVLDRPAVTWVVSAAPADRLEPYLWHFPVVGDVPYKGFFDPQDARAEADDLAARGYDTHVRPVAAYSLLGWVPDPLYSPMLDYDPATLANIILHELTHATVFLAGASSFNEGFASFIGDQGAVDFMRARYGPGSPALREAEADRRDAARFTAFVADLAREMKAFYAEPRDRAALMQGRADRFRAAQQRFATLPMETRRYRGFAKATLNNAYLGTLLTYQSHTERFEQVYVRLGRDLPRMVRFFRDEVAKAANPEAFLDAWLATAQ